MSPAAQEQLSDFQMHLDGFLDFRAFWKVFMDTLKMSLSVAALEQVVARFSRCSRAIEASVSTEEEAGIADVAAASSATEMVKKFFMFDGG